MSASKHTDLRARTGDLIGQLAGEYRILRKLGAGGFGTVYEAEHPLLKRRAAVKVLHSSPAVDSVAVQRFIAEARSASQIRHPHIVDIFSFGTLPNGQYFYVMDLLEGAPLDRYLRDQTRLPVRLALPLLRPIARAIDALHSASLVHRDLKPANIFLAWDSNGDVVPKLLDFGLVKLLGDVSRNTTTGQPLGTPFYMSPEQCQGQKVDGHADIYSFGVICFEMLTGNVPFTGDTATAVLLAHVLHPPPPMSSVFAELPAELDEPVLRMLAKEPSERPASACEALDALQAAAARAGLSTGDDLRTLPRPTSTPPPDPSEFEADSTVEQSGTREGPGVSPRFARWVWLAIAPLVALSWFIGEARRDPAPSEDAPQAEHAPSPAPPPNPAVPKPLRAASAATDAPSLTTAKTAAAIELAPPSSVRVRIRGAPRGAEVFLGEQKLGAAVDEVLVPFGNAPVQLSVVAPGRPPRSVQVTPKEAVEVELAPEKRPAKRTAVSRDLENPF